MKLLPMLLLLAVIINPVPRYWFDLVCDKTGVAFDYGKQEDHDTVRKLMLETIKREIKEKGEK